MLHMDVATQREIGTSGGASFTREKNMDSETAESAQMAAGARALGILSPVHWEA